jgi:hypothetical protein
MYRVKHDLPEGELGEPATPVFPAAMEEPKLEQLVGRLMDLVSGGATDSKRRKASCSNGPTPQALRDAEWRLRRTPHLFEEPDGAA